MSGRAATALFASALAAAACAPLPPPAKEKPRVVERPAPRPPSVPVPAPAPAPRPLSDVESLLALYQQVRSLPPAEVAREHDAARAAYELARTDFNRVRYALMLTLPDTAFNDEARALNVLEPVSRTGKGALQGLARLLVAQLQERQRLDASVQDLQQKLDALKSLERSMIERKR